MTVLQAAGVPICVSMNNRDLSEDPHLNAGGFFVQLEHPEVGVRQHVGIPWRMSDTSCAVRRPAPCLGEATDYVLKQVLGYDEARIADLRRSGVLT